MKPLLKDDFEYNGIKLDEYEAGLLRKLCGRLSLSFLRSKGFTDEEAFVVIRWYDMI